MHRQPPVVLRQGSVFHRVGRQLVDREREGLDARGAQAHPVRPVEDHARVAMRVEKAARLELGPNQRVEGYALAAIELRQEPVDARERQKPLAQARQEILERGRVARRALGDRGDDAEEVARAVLQFGKQYLLPAAKLVEDRRRRSRFRSIPPRPPVRREPAAPAPGTSAPPRPGRRGSGSRPETRRGRPPRARRRGRDDGRRGGPPSASRSRSPPPSSGRYRPSIAG